MTALVVDDSSIMRRVIDRTMRQAGLGITEFLQAATGADALDLLRARAVSALPSLILSDINMPGMNGIELVTRLREEHLAMGVPVVMITAEGTEPAVLRAMAAGASGYIRKPFTAAQIRATLAPLLAELAKNETLILAL